MLTRMKNIYRKVIDLTGHSQIKAILTASTKILYYVIIPQNEDQPLLSGCG